MAILVSLFLISFIAIIILFGRKLSLIQSQNINIVEKEHTAFKIPYILEIKHITIKKIKKYGYLILVTTIRIYFRSLNLLKRKYKELKTKIGNSNKSEVQNTKKQEINRFLKGISDYKNKIRKIKHDIKEEENRIQ